jgi:hypothetical protein
MTHFGSRAAAYGSLACGCPKLVVDRKWLTNINNDALDPKRKQNGGGIIRAANV